MKPLTKKPNQPVVHQVKRAYVAWTNTDRTEGRGVSVPHAICETLPTATREAEGVGVQGVNGDVTEVTLYFIGSHWYGPVRVTPATEADLATQKRIDEREAVIRRAKEAGLSEEDIKILKYK